MDFESFSMDSSRIVRGHIVDVVRHTIMDGAVVIGNGHILSIRPEKVAEDAPYLLPGFIDAHIHIESTLLTPEHYAALAVTKGVVAAVTDPHEIANVCGMDGIDFMIQNGAKVHFNFHFAASSCVPSTPFETAGATLDHQDLEKLLQRDEICCVAEFMNVPGVIFQDPECLAKIEAAEKAGKPIDGHAPGVSKETLALYAAAGISTDHECVSLQEAQDHLDVGMSVIIREGSASLDYEALSPLLMEHDDHLMFCSDDQFPEGLMKNYIDDLVRRSVAKGYPLWNVLNAACLTPVRHYKLRQGLLQVGDKADFILVDNLTDFNVKATYIDGLKVFEDGHLIHEAFYDDVFPLAHFPNHFDARPVSVGDLQVPAKGETMKVIVAANLSIRTDTLHVKPSIRQGEVVSDTDADILKMVVCNRYQPVRPQMAFIHGFQLKQGAMATSIAHDSHNIVAIGTNDRDLVCAINRLIELKGGMILCDGDETYELPLPIAGLMSNLDGQSVDRKYQVLLEQVRRHGCPFEAPFMTLSFMCLPVIPEIKLTDKGLFDSAKFEFTDLFN